MPKLTRVAVTGAAGQIAYSLLFRIAEGAMFGSETPVALHLLEVPASVAALEGVVMELQDCAFPLLKEIHFGSDAKKVFRDVQWALLVGSKPRGPGMERKDLLLDNGRIFVEQGQALNEVAATDVRVVVVGNPCNTNCLIAMHNAPRIPKENFHAMTRLDQNRAMAQLAIKANVPVESIEHFCIWGNHSSTQVPDFVNATIGKKSVPQAVGDENWLKNTFVETVQKRGAAIIAARGKSSAASAASALIDAVHALVTPTPAGQFFSTAVYSANNSYGFDRDLIFGFPCRSKGDGNYEIVADIPLNAYLREKIALSEKELQEERSLVCDLIPKKMCTKGSSSCRG